MMDRHMAGQMGVNGWVCRWVDGWVWGSAAEWMGAGGCIDEGATQSVPGVVRVYWQALQQELALCWSSMEKLDERAQMLAGAGAPEQLGAVRERLREQLRALQERAATR